MKKSLPLLFVVLFFGCNINELDFDNLQNPNLTGRVALPLGTVKYTMRELLDEVGDDELDLEEDSATSLLKLTYFDTAQFNSGQDIISIEDVVNVALIDVPAIDPTPNSQVRQIDTVFTFSYPAENNEAVDSVFYKDGTLQVEVSSNVGSDISYQFTIENTRRISDNIAASFSGDLEPFETEVQSQSLEGHKTSLTLENNENTFLVNASITIFLGPGESTGVEDDVNVTVSYLNQTFNILYGKFGQDRIQVGNELLDIKFFEDIGQSGFKFGSPEITFDFENTFGLPLGLLFQGLYGVDSTSQGIDTTYLSGSVTNNPQLIEGSQRLNEPARSTIVITSQNSSLRDLLAKSPRTLGFSLSAITNPNDPNVSNFVIDTSRVSTNIEISMPLELSLRDVEREIKFDLGSGLQFDEADSLAIRVVSNNQLPFSARVVMEILDEVDSVTHAVPQRLVLEAPFLDLQGFVSQPRRHFVDVPLSTDGIAALRDGKNLRLRVFLNTPGSTASRDQYVKVLADYSLDIKVSVLGKLNVEL